MCKIVSVWSFQNEKQLFTFGRLKILLNPLTNSAVASCGSRYHYQTTLQPLKIFVALHVFLVPIISSHDKHWGLARRVFTLFVYIYIFVIGGAGDLLCIRIFYLATLGNRLERTWSRCLSFFFVFFGDFWFYLSLLFEFQFKFIWQLWETGWRGLGLAA